MHYCGDLIADYTVATQKTATRVLAETKHINIITWPKLNHFIIPVPDVVLIKPLSTSLSACSWLIWPCITWRWIVWWLVNDELEMMWKEAAWRNLRHNLRYNPEFCSEELNKASKFSLHSVLGAGFETGITGIRSSPALRLVIACRMDVRAVITTRPPHRRSCDVPTKYVKRQVTHALDKCFWTLVRPRPGKFFFYKTRARSQQVYS